ncbi:myoneurin-like [Chrysoperla carnea]|uniref:myoneurin-like n=1 Tax=Chrysoperla carnea TaxID=189513 RepID=UPI001D084163|nr:myoneurin-like [Chrysoperla carnea]
MTLQIIPLHDVEYSIPLIVPEKKYEINNELEKEIKRVYILKDTTCNLNQKTYVETEISPRDLIKILPKNDKIINETSDNSSFIGDNIDNSDNLVFTNVNYTTDVKLPTILIADINIDQIEIENSVKIETEEPAKSSKKPKTQIVANNSKSIDPIKEPKVFKCTMDHCNARMKNANNLEYHLKCHNKTEFLCPECPTNFNVWNSLRGHLWRKHKIDIELYGCDKCDYKTFSLSQLNNIHKRIHTDMKPFLCDICAKAFKNPKQLRTHKTIHKPSYKMCNFVCDLCNRPFACRRLLKLHVEGVHQQLKRFLCNYCGYKANSKSAVQLHERKHTGQKPYECEFCDYSTTDHNSLRRHKSKHNGEYSYRCPYCSYACIQSSTFKIHIKSKHPNVEHSITFSCKYCNFKSLRKDNYLAHVAKHNVPPTFVSDTVNDPLAATASNDLQILARNTNKNINVIENALVQNDTKLDLYTIPLLINSSNKNLFINQNNCVIERLDNSGNSTVIEENDDIKLTKTKLIQSSKQATDNSKFLFVSTNDFSNNLDNNTYVLDSNLVVESNTQSFLVSNLNLPPNCGTNVLPST